eukprot:TRINITY_DN1201_c0_g1_i2.p1 TRINITY_DN1201_c0_g1~~TRINITY_DN1201_c0_g1_i2.p1  ORF type:complete len:172 (-),score=41.64 TRINITY_DN1201_c0_g1_i2:229-744(-)
MDQTYTVYFNTDPTTMGYDPNGSNLPTSTAADVVGTGGASVLSNPVLSLRSGNPGEVNYGYLTTALQDATHGLDGFDFTYQYITGYSGGGKGAYFMVGYEDQTGKKTYGYTSPVLTDYEYDLNPSNYSKPVTTHASGMRLPVGFQRVIFEFHNQDRNLQIKLGFPFVALWR